MPEGDTVWLACRQLDAALAGRALTRCELRVPQLATTDFTGVVVDAVVSRGKHQLTRFADLDAVPLAVETSPATATADRLAVLADRGATTPALVAGWAPLAP